MPAAALLLLLAAGHYGYMLSSYPWAAWATLQGCIGAWLCWLVRRGRGRAWHAVALLGVVLQGMVAACQGINWLVVELHPGPGEQMCDAATTLPVTLLGLIAVTALAVWLDDRSAGRPGAHPHHDDPPQQ